MKKYLVTFLLPGCLLANAFAADSYTIDPAHAQAYFDINRLGFSSQKGRFNKTHGKVQLDLAAKMGSVEFTIDTESIDMGSAAWSAHLADKGLFNVKAYPTMTFKSDKLIFEGQKVVAAQGNFTMLGVTKPLTVTVNNFQCRASTTGIVRACSGNIAATMKRSDFGLTKYIPAVSDEVAVSVSVDAYKD